MAEQRVVVEVDLGVEREQVAAAGDDQRIDLDAATQSVSMNTLYSVAHELVAPLDLLAGRGRARRRACGPGTAEAERGIDATLEDLLGRLVRDLLDLHAAFGRGHEMHRARRRDRPRMPRYSSRAMSQPSSTIDALDIRALGTGLLGHEHLAEHVRDLRRHHRPIRRCGRRLCPTVFGKMTGAAPTGVDLSLHDT